MTKRQKNKRIKDIAKNKDIYNLNTTLAKLILPRLKRFRILNINSYSSDFKSINEWHEAVDKMIWSFNFALDIDLDSDISSEMILRYSEGMHLFATYFMDLWD